MITSKALVTGVEEHQGLAVVRGLGLKGIPVVACGADRNSLGFRSRFATECYTYTSPHRDKTRFIEDILRILDSCQADIVVSGLESTLLPLDHARAEIEKRAILAAPSSEILHLTIDKLRTVELAHRNGVPVPRTAHADTAIQLLSETAQMRFPVAIKPRGSRLHERTKHPFGFKVMYADTPESLRDIVLRLETLGGLPLVQEYAPGIGLCVASVFDRGRPLVHFPYLREREWPITGGISVLRKGLPPDSRLNAYVESLLGSIGFHGVAMTEFKYDSDTDTYVLMEVNPRFQASTMLSIDSGVNLPWLVYAIHTGQKVEPVSEYRVGVHERYLRGDTMSLLDYILGDTIRSAAGPARSKLPSRFRVLWWYLRDFRPGIRYDEFKSFDWRPALTEAGSLAKHTIRRLRHIAGIRLRRLLRRSS